MTYRFSFGQPLHKVEQRDRTPKRYFVLGVYASAVHAQWVTSQGEVVVRALAVASEPEIFWRGDGAAQILDRIEIPVEVGRLTPPGASMNGPSGRSLDSLYLAPLSVHRSETWLCDLLPESRLNAGQKRAIDTHYQPWVSKGVVDQATVPSVPRHFADDIRRKEIMDEIRLSQASTLVTLGDVPLREFVAPLAGMPARLSDFGRTPDTYGHSHEVTLDRLEVSLIPLVHPRQASGLGRSSSQWGLLHKEWITRKGG